MSLCLNLRSNLQRLADALGEADLSIIEERDGSCVIMAHDLSVRFTLDNRDGQVTSSISFGDSPPNGCYLYIHILSRLFDLPNSAASSESLFDKIQRECDRVVSVLKGMKSRNLKPRDLYYFQYGYNSAYTDYASGKWDS